MAAWVCQITNVECENGGGVIGVKIGFIGVLD